MNTAQKKITIGAIAVLGAIAYLVYAGIQETSVYYLTVSEALSKARPGDAFRMEGKVVPGTIEKDDDALGALFKIQDENKSIQVRYKGTIPDMFQDEADVVVEGTFDKTGVFKAHTLLTSCPSRYEAAEEDMKSQGRPAGI